jgi:hypothetical protein
MGGTSGRRGGARITGQAAARESRGLRAVGVAVSKIALPIVARRGGGILVRLKSQWVAIAGPDWGEVSWPTALGRDGVLKLRALPGAALELQHRAPLLIDRINQFFGRSIISRLTFVQGPLPLLPRPSRPVLRPLPEGAAEALGRRLSGISDPDLRAALTRLGRAVTGQQQ